jgi:hypothetical protein
MENSNYLANQLKPIAIILLVACLFLNMGGYTFLFNLHQKAIKKEMRKQLRSVALEDQDVFEMHQKDGEPNDPDFAWEDAHEFVYKGKMYDVIETKLINGKLQVRCIEDAKEESLISQLSETHKQQQKQGATGSLLKSLLSAVFIPSSSIATDPGASLILKHIIYYSASHQNIAGEILVPPPRVQFS